jgi:hypothetical protein
VTVWNAASIRFSSNAASADVVEHLVEKRSVIVAAAHRVRSAVCSGVTSQCSSGVVEADALPRVPLEPAASFGCVETVFDVGEDLEPEIPADDHTLGVPVAPEGDRFGVDTVAFERRDDLGEFGSRFSGG